MHVNVFKIHIEANIVILPGVVSVCVFFVKEKMKQIFKFKNINDSIKVNSIIPVEYDDSDYDMRYEYRDRERELYERDRDREMERERYLTLMSPIFWTFSLEAILNSNNVDPTGFQFCLFDILMFFSVSKLNHTWDSS